MSQSIAAQRKAWNEAMQSAAGTAALPSSLQPQKKRRTTRSSKTSRRDKARKSNTKVATTEEQQDFNTQQAAAWMDALEDVPIAGVGGEDVKDNDDDSYNELEELEEEYESGSKRKRKTKKKPTRKRKATTTNALPKRFQLRSLASILSEEVSHPDGVAKEWLETEAKGKQATAKIKYCPVTGLQGIYQDPKTNLPYANLQALEQIRERPPPWTTLGGALAYHEAVKSIRDE